MAAYRKSRKNFLVFFWSLSLLVLNNVAVAAALPTEDFSKHLRELDKELSSQEYNISKNIATLSTAIHRTSVGPQLGPTSLFSGEGTNSRERLRNFLSATLKMKLRQLEQIQKQRSYIRGEFSISDGLDLMKDSKATWKSSKNEDFKKCLFFPIKTEESFESLEQSVRYGEMLNPKLGKVSSKSQGNWWRHANGLLAQACAPGEVVMTELVEGRGFVVAIRHSANIIAIYGNLDEKSVKQLKLGSKLPAGAPLGLVKDSFYFEVRRGEEAFDPAEVLPLNKIN